ncbi:protein associated with UVRAG as autophagy enhancer [Leptodactylus fuscus]
MAARPEVLNRELSPHCNRVNGFPAKSIHALSLTSYNTEGVQRCAKMTEVANNKRYLDYKPSDPLDLPMTKVLRFPPVLFEEDVLPRPPVIQVVGCYGSYPDTATAIKEVLCSALSIPNKTKSSSVTTPPTANEVLALEGSSANGKKKYSRCGTDGIALMSHAQNDIRFNRHTAVWDNSPAMESPASLHSVPITKIMGAPELAFTPYLKCRCVKVTLPRSSSVLLKTKRRFSSASIAPQNPQDPTSKQFTLDMNKTGADSEAPTTKEKSFLQSSSSYSSLLKESEENSLTSSAENVYEPSVNLEKENEHFMAADLFMSLLEKTRSGLQYNQCMNVRPMPRPKKTPVERFYQRTKAHCEYGTSVDSGYGGEMEKCGKMSKNQSEVTKTGPKLSAEQTARNLYRAFRHQWTAEGDGRVQLPKTFSVKTISRKIEVPAEFESSVNLVEEIKRCKMKDTEEWSPPQFQIITTRHQYATRHAIIESQKYLCAGCGTKVEPNYTSRLRYCDYLDKYFCDCCHQYSESSIPSRILLKWNFSKYYVSNVSKSIIDKIWDRHKFNVLKINPDVYKKVKELNRVKEVQQQLIYISRLVMICRFADSVIKAFKEVPSHLTQRLHVFTLADLYQVKQNLLLQRLHDLLALTISHVDSCELCQARGFICEFCRHCDVIYPYQTDLCSRCEACKSCYHKKCFKNKNCPKCIRIKARQAIIDSILLSTEVDATGQ